MKIRVLLADDHRIVRDGLRFILEAQGDIQVVADASDGQEAIQQVKKHCPDVVVMDVAMPVLNGIVATEKIKLEHADTRVIILSMHSTTEHIYRSLRAGATGYLLKEAAGAEVVSAVRAVHQGKRFLSQKITEMMIDDYILHRQEGFALSPLEKLSIREREVMQMVVEGFTSEEIALKLNLSASTVDTYRSRLMKKLCVKDLPALMRFAVDYGIV